MRLEHRLLLRDLLTGVVPLFVGGSYLSSTFEWWMVPLVCLAGALWAGLYYASERALYPDSVTRLADRPDVVAAVAFAGLLLAVTSFVFVSAAVTLFYAGFFGMGVGHVGYRVLCGVVRPVPDLAVERMRRQQS